MNKRFVLQIFRSLVTLILFVTMAAMIFSLRKELARERAKVAALQAEARR